MEQTTIVHRRPPQTPAPPRQAPAELELGRELSNRYVVLEQVGQGAMGTVYRAWDRKSSSVVALKVVHRESAIAVRFRRGSKALLRMRHPGITEALGCGRHEELDYLVTRYYAGTSLAEALEWLGPWDPPEAVRLTVGLLQALDYLHRQGYVHRDVKPSNILLTTNGEPILADFDLAKPFTRTNDSGCFSRELLEEALQDSQGCLSGTPLYLPLQRLRGEPAEPGDDVYSAALVLYQLLSGRLPHDVGQYRDLSSLLAAREGRVPTLTSLSVELPRELERVILRALDPEREARYGSGAELIAALKRGERPQTSGRFRVVA
ncbi:MAG: serine/threonine-protein kinase [Planctomycetota bacterium]